LDIIDATTNEEADAASATNILTPLPSYNLPDQLATPFIYGIQIDTPLHKLIFEEATTMALSSSSISSSTPSTLPSSPSLFQRPMYGHLIWKNKSSDSLIGAVGCTAEILVNAPTTEVLFGVPPSDDDNDNDNDDDDLMKQILQGFATSSGSEAAATTTPNTVLCRGGYRFVVKDVIKTIPFPVAIVDEIIDDTDVDDTDILLNSKVTKSMDDDDDDDDDDDEDDDFDDELSKLSPPELIQRIMIGVSSIIKTRLEDATAKNNLSPLEKAILEDSNLSGGGPPSKDNPLINPAAIELAHAEEMAAVWAVFQASLVDDIEPQDRRFAIAIMAAELANMSNSGRQKILLTRNAEERLRIVLREVNEINGMATAKKIASTITSKVDELDKDLKVGTPELPRWALQLTKGTKIEYFWNEEYGWCAGEVMEDPVTVVDEILLTIRFYDGEVHKLPLNAEDKIRWRPG
jgi:hypothetical protein